MALMTTSAAPPATTPAGYVPLLDDRIPAADPATVPHTVLPLGGIGTGSVGLAADGGLRQWQLHNVGNHTADLPGSFFALRVSRWEPPLDEIRVLQAAAPATPTDTPLVTDDRVPPWQRELLRSWPGMRDVSFRSLYPAGEVRFADPDVPLDVTVQAVNPLVPLDVDASSVPAVLLTVRLRNRDDYPLHGAFGAALQNAVGWDGRSPLDGVRGAGYGGNTNRVVRGAGWTAAVLENAGLAEDDPGAGQFVLAADDERTSVLRQFRTPAEFRAFLASLTRDEPLRHGSHGYAGASGPGETWCAGLAVPFRLEPGAERVVRIALTWHLPNRYVDFDQFGPPAPEWGRSRFWLGNHYATRFADAQDVFARVRSEWDDLHERTRGWLDTLAGSALTDDERLHLAAQAVPLRTPSCFRAADGRFFGFEGVLGASTVMWAGDTGGSCPLNCTHVWNYAQAAARFWPELERSMRDTEFDVMQAPEGYIPHRVIVPTYLRQLWDVPIGGPDEPALDGMLGTVLKSYREVRGGAGVAWLRHRWPALVRLLEHIRAKWADDDGVLTGVQPSTHDIDLTGTNTFQGTLWLAALRAAARMAQLVGDDTVAAWCDDLGERASAAYDRELWTGEYYRQVLRSGDSAEFQWESGCLADQLIGQWWAHLLDLGHLLPAEHVRTALRSVVRHNLRDGFEDFEQPYRTFADGDDAGVLMCTWPHGGRPDVPTRYCDEVWTGSEYQLAAHCRMEGLHDEADAVLAAVWARYDGRRRNPYNEIECGDHYVRAMAGWSVLDALTGFREDAVAATVSFGAAPRSGPLPFLASTGWGWWDAGSGVLTCRGGSVSVGARTLRPGDSVTLPAGG